jgi:hypothetical protein
VLHSHEAKQEERKSYRPVADTERKLRYSFDHKNSIIDDDDEEIIYAPTGHDDYFFNK